MYQRDDFFIPGTDIVQPITEVDGVPGIYGLFGPYRALSNYHVCPVKVDGITYHSSEAAYMAQKTNVVKEKLKLAEITVPNKAKAYGQKVTLREDWDENDGMVKKYEMFRVLHAKFGQNPDVAKLLLSTGKLYIEETNWWGDNFWGVCHRDLGRNELGLTLMSQRYILAAD